MPHLHLRARPSVSGVRIVHALRPLRASEDELALSALGVPAVLRLIGLGEAAKGNTGVDDAGLEDVGVGTSKDAGHHCAGGRADGEDTVGVDAPIGDGEPRCGGNPDGVATPVVLQRSI